MQYVSRNWQNQDQKMTKSEWAKILEKHSISQWTHLIDEWIFSQRDRDIMKEHLINGMTYSELAEIHRVEPLQIQRIMNKGRKTLLKHLDDLN